MNNFSAYLDLLNDTILSSLMFIPKLSYVGDTMILLGNYNLYLILIVSLFGGVIGAIANWIIGRLLRNLFSSKADAFIRAEKFVNNGGKWILLLSMIPLWGALFTTAAGFVRYSFAHFLILVTFSKFIGYSIAIFF